VRKVREALGKVGKALLGGEGLWGWSGRLWSRCGRPWGRLGRLGEGEEGGESSEEGERL
jgi:hypothetical protein